MEYRRRRKKKRNMYRGTASAYSGARRNRSNEGSGFAGALLILLLTAGLIYIIFGTSVGTWLAKNVFPNSNHNESPSPTNNILSTEKPIETDTETERMSFTGIEAFALQMGVYSQTDSANGLVASLKSLGAAGYKYIDGSNVRIFASIYNTEAAAESVSERLTNQGYECMVFPINVESVEIDVTAAADKIDRVRLAVNFAQEILTDLFNEVIDFDAEERSIDYGRAICTEMLTNIKTIRNDLKNTSDNSGVIGLLDDYYMHIEGLLTQFIASDTINRVEMSGQLKHLQIDAIVKYISLLNAIQSFSN